MALILLWGAGYYELGEMSNLSHWEKVLLKVSYSSILWVHILNMIELMQGQCRNGFYDTISVNLSLSRIPGLGQKVSARRGNDVA